MDEHIDPQSSPALNRHEIIKWSQSYVGAKLTAPDGTVINSSNCNVTLTNQSIRIVATSPVTYTVVNKGDRTFKSVIIPLRIAKPHRFIQPWFGPYKWETLASGQLQNDDLEPRGAMWTVTLIFNNGGAFEYRKQFLAAFSDIAQAAQDGMDEPLPAYSEV